MSSLISHNPWDPQDRVHDGVAAEASDIAAALHVSSAASPGWAKAGDRGDHLRRFATILTGARDEVITLLVREAGKTRADAGAEADLLPKKISVTLEQALARTTTSAGAPIVWRPRGVALVIGPYNFPLHLLHGMVIPALAVGCPVIAKPSERCPALGELYRRLIVRAGLGDVCQVLQGDSRVATALARDQRIATVAAVGSRTMGLGLAKTLAERPEVVLALELGGVNHALVLDDADRDAAITAIAEGAWRMAGQRCTATRIAHVPVAWLDQIIAALVVARRQWVATGDPTGNAGPLIAADLRESFQIPYRSLPHGIELVAGNTSADSGSCFAEPLLLVVRDHAVRASAMYCEEHFGPALVIDTYTTLDDAIARIAANPSRLAASVFTVSRDRFRTVAAALPYGQVNWNRPTAGARSDLPFGGCGLSGNGRPGAVAACQIFADETVVWE